MAVSLDTPQSLNRYSYVNNMPLSYFDQTGLCGQGVTDISHAECDGSYGGQGGAGGSGGGGGSWNLQCVQSFTNLGPSGGTTSCWWDWTAGSGQAARAPQRLNIDRSGWGGGGIDWARWRTRVKEFFKLSGGPGNVPTCAEVALQNIGQEFIPFSPSGASVIQATAPAVQAMAFNSAVAQTTASVDAYVAARGLTVPLRSTVVRGMIAQGAESAVAAGARANVAVQTLAVDYAAIKSTVITAGQARSGQCAAAFPIF